MGMANARRPLPSRQRDPTIDLGVERFQLSQVIRAGPDVQIQPFVPAALVEDAFVRIAAQERLADDRLAVRVAAFEDAHLVEQRDEQSILRHRRGNVMSAPRMRRRAIGVAARGAAGRLFEFEQHEILKAGFAKAPRGGQPRDAAAHDDDAAPLPAIRGRREFRAVAQPMTEADRRADDLARRQRRHGRGATGESGGQPQERGQHFAACETGEPAA